ncbi:hypothetical protein V2A85_24325, partial [Yersinia sp. 1252 StPb PI]|uniref:hypothetical protein n=1 Tax=Yersinia sp. 1252 StPb PI TaxID=3117404 RepID=UPI003B28242D
MEFEKNFNKPSSPLLLEELIVTGDFVIKYDYTDPLWEKKRQVISNGLCEVELTVKSTDGYNIFSQMKSGRPPSSSKISYSIPLADTHIKIIDGLHYVKNSIFEPDGNKSHIMGAIAEMKIHESNGSSSIKNLRHRSDFEVD